MGLGRLLPHSKMFVFPAHWIAKKHAFLNIWIVHNWREGSNKELRETNNEGVEILSIREDFEINCWDRQGEEVRSFLCSTIQIIWNGLHIMELNSNHTVLDDACKAFRNIWLKNIEEDLRIESATGGDEANSTKIKKCEVNAGLLRWRGQWNVDGAWSRTRIRTWSRARSRVRGRTWHRARSRSNRWSSYSHTLKGKNKMVLSEDNSMKQKYLGIQYQM